MDAESTQAAREEAGWYWRQREHAKAQVRQATRRLEDTEKRLRQLHMDELADAVARAVAQMPKEAYRGPAAI